MVHLSSLFPISMTNPVTELQPLKFTDSVNNIEFRVQGDNAPEEIIRLDSKGFHYRGQLIEDAGEAHRLMVEFLKQQTQPEPVAPTDEELWAVGNDDFRANCYPNDAIRFARTVLARWGTPTIAAELEGQ